MTAEITMKRNGKEYKNILNMEDFTDIWDMVKQVEELMDDSQYHLVDVTVYDSGGETYEV